MVSAAAVLTAWTGRGAAQVVTQNKEDNDNVYIPAMDPKLNKYVNFPVVSASLVVDVVRNTRDEFKSTVNSLSDFWSHPNVRNAHFIAIGNTGRGMTVYSKPTADELNEDIEKILVQLPDTVRNVTFYHRKDPDNYPRKNVYTGTFVHSHPAPHQDFYREP